MDVRRRGWSAVALCAAMVLLCVFSGGLSARAEETLGDRWYPLDPEAIAPGDVVAITMEYDRGIWALDTACGPAEVSLEEDALLSFGGDIGWQVDMVEGCFAFLSPAGNGHLGYSDLRKKLNVSTTTDSRWTLKGGQLFHLATSRWLCLEEKNGEAAWTARQDYAGDQFLRFWTPFPPEGPGEPDPTEETDDPWDPEEPFELPDLPWTPWFGQLHAHTAMSDGVGEVEEAFRFAREEAGLDFFAVTEHSSSFDRATDGQLSSDGAAVSEKWARGKAAAAEASGEDYLALFGFEMTWPDTSRQGHIVTFGTPGFQTTEQPGMGTLEGYYRALAETPGAVGMFAHPGMFDENFDRFSHREAAFDIRMNLLEVGSENGFRAWEAYGQALDAGWHVAPTMSQASHNGNWGMDGGRTVVLSEELTEASFYEALDARRVYATEDADLMVLFTLNGQIMGSRIPATGEAVAQIWLEDPTDPIGTVEVLTQDGQVLEWDRAEGHQAVVEFLLPGDQPYYYLRITQPDGDLAVTAPVWLERYEDMGILDLTAQGSDLQGRKAELELTLYNNEPVPLEITEVTIWAEDNVLYSGPGPGVLEPLSQKTVTAEYLVPVAGMVDYTAEVSGTVNGAKRSWAADCQAWYREPALTTGLLAWGFQEAELQNLSALAWELDLGLEVVVEELPEGGSVLLMGPPPSPLSPEFLAQVLAFAESGGTLVLCGQAEDDMAVQVLNDLLAELGSTLRLRSDRALDQENSGDQPDRLFPAVFSDGAVQAGSLLEGQYYRHLAGCTVDSGGGSWLVKGWPSSYSSEGLRQPVLLAWEPTAWGGRIAAAGCPFFTDEAMPLPRNDHTLPSANQSFLETLLGKGQDRFPRRDIGDLRLGEIGGIYRIQGHVTAGNAGSYNTFPGTIYLQDGTGGIAVVDTRRTNLTIGHRLEVLGTLAEEEGNLVLEIIQDTLPEESIHRYLPLSVTCQEAGDYLRHGGRLLQVEGVVAEVDRTGDGQGVQGFTLRDGTGWTTQIRVEGTIRSRATGRNDLAAVVRQGSTVRVAGLLHMEDGEPVLRVRDCEEVRSVSPPPEIPERETGPRRDPAPPNVWLDPDYVPSERPRWPWQGSEDPGNPKTGDWLWRFWIP